MLQFSRAKTIVILGAVVIGLLFAAPNVMPASMRASLPGIFPSKTVNLGLDLQGGAHVLLEVQTEVVVKERLEDVKVEVRQALFNRDAGIRIQHGSKVRNTPEGQELSVVITNLDEVARALELIKPISRPIASGGGFGALQNDLEITSRGTQEIVLRLSEPGYRALEEDAVSQVIETVRNRIDELGTREPSIQRQGDNRIIVQVPGAENTQQVKDIVSQTAKLTLRAVYSDNMASIQEAQQGRTFRDADLLPTDNPNEPFLLIESRATIKGEMLVNAQPAFDQQTGRPVVSFRLNSAGARIFAKYTSENVGKRFAIILDERVISAPVINGPIPSGNAQISGNFTVETAENLSIVLRAGALRAPVKVVEERSVGPEMGADSIEAGEFAAVFGLVAVILFIVLAYGRFGLYANVALIANLILILGVLSMLQATLTLPGIAGIVLTIGMAVDANVLIFERMREEIAAGKTPLNAVETGYTKAWSAIWDANVTTFIAAAILFMVGTGPVKGFAVTLAIGIFTSVFTAFVLTRFIVAAWLRRAKPSHLPI